MTKKFVNRGQPLWVKLIAASLVKTDRWDTLVLARLLAANLIPAIWIPPVEGRELRALMAHRERFKEARLQTKSDIGPPEIRKFCQLDQTGTNLKAAMQQMQLSARAYHRILKLARTIADLAGEPDKEI